ncbi:MAG: hypothetical protein IPG50_02790 [Myxococcales bacterium]|nr:hypothetical protein [Myxococcales bacterium]
MALRSGGSALWAPVLDGLKRMKASWPARGFSWDSRLICLTSSFHMDHAAKAKAATLDALPQEWTASTLGSAPPRVREFVERTGGLRAGQFAFATAPAGGLIAFGLWWPWNDNDTISFRVGFLDVDPNEEPYPTVRDLFGVTL